MKLLLDENLSPRLIELLAELYPGSAHVHNIGLGATDDAEVWIYAKQNGFIICTKDADFHERSILLGSPPKVVWIRLGNCSTRRIEHILRKHHVDIQTMANDNEASFMILI